MSRKWLVGLLIASVVVNLGLAGYIVGKYFGPRVHGPTVFTQSSSYVPRMLHSLPKARQDELIESMQLDRRSMREQYMDIREAQQAVVDVIVSDPFNPKEYQASQKNLNELYSNMKQRHDQFLENLLSQMSAEERATVMQSLIRGTHSRHSDRDRKRKSQPAQESE